MNNNLFSGLEQLGLSGMDDMDLFDSEEKQDEAAKDSEEKEQNTQSETEFLYDKTFQCPVCERSFKTKAIRMGKARMLSLDRDLRPRYQGIDTIKYDVVVCGKCGYAALSRFFNSVTLAQAKRISTEISPAFKGIDNSQDTYSYDDAILRYRLALANSVVKKSKASERAYTCLKIAWLMRGKAENLPEDTKNYDEAIKELGEQEQAFTAKAYEGFQAAMLKEGFPICGMDEFTFLYLVAELGRRCKDYSTSYKLAGDILTSRGASVKIKDMTRDLKELLREEREKEQKE